MRRRVQSAVFDCPRLIPNSQLDDIPVVFLRPPKSSQTLPFPDGIKLWYDPPDACVDICFVHGLTGNRDSTWTADGEEEPWPKILLANKLNRARIITWGYDAYVVRISTASQNKLLDHATNPVRDITDHRSDNTSSRPLYFIAHSLGGLACKRAVLLSRHNADLHFRSVFDTTRGILFLGTPHSGSWLADWSRIPANALGLFKSSNVSLLETLKTDNQLLHDLQRDFMNMVREMDRPQGPLQVACFFEELGTKGAGIIVTKESATFPGYDPASIHANHRDMVKFASEDDNGFKRVLGDVRRWIATTR
ncbi:hypothetical protein EDD37DRAFT_671616 [Exophiala viscosa]|uniref:uncharacterized protein n=1 Tax=Exophiala viscosa TaxID=2486360 RepID=UPI00219FA18D|nr:hypothetical protein EDD37DRAFT_671616 [Exophiala viscosa]